MDRKAKKLMEFLNSLKISKWGIGDIKGLHEVSNKYPKAISLIVGFDPSSNKYVLEEYYKVLTGAYEKLNKEVDKLKQFLIDQSIEHMILDGSSYFSYTMAGAQAGLGWVGKSSLLVTPEFGPRIAIETILINSDIPCNRPVTDSHCENCSACSKICPVQCIHNLLWKPGMHAMELRDGNLCEQKQYACGACLMTCPKGFVK